MRIAVVKIGEDIVGVFTPESGERYAEGINADVEEYVVDALKPKAFILLDIVFAPGREPYVMSARWVDEAVEPFVRNTHVSEPRIAYVKLTATSQEEGMRLAKQELTAHAVR